MPFYSRDSRNSTLRNAAEGEFPARVPSLQPEPKARDAAARVQEYPSANLRTVFFSTSEKKLLSTRTGVQKVAVFALVLKK